VAGVLWRLSPVFQSALVAPVLVTGDDFGGSAALLGDYSDMPVSCRPLLRDDSSGRPYYAAFAGGGDGNGMYSDHRRFDHPGSRGGLR
jgi:hypothetical protein